jgi:hypothetical protein
VAVGVGDSVVFQLDGEGAADAIRRCHGHGPADGAHEAHEKATNEYAFSEIRHLPTYGAAKFTGEEPMNFD